MIVRILLDGQYELDEMTFESLLGTDAALEDALAKNDQDKFSKALNDAVETVHRAGRRLEAEQIVPSDLALPPIGATLEEVHELLTSES